MANARNTSRFFDEIDTDFEVNVIKESVKRRNDISIFLLTRIIENTPFRTGLARGNWKVVPGGNVPSDTIKVKTLAAAGPSGRKTKSGKGALKAGVTQILKSPNGDVTIYNPLDYVAVIDQGGFVPKNPGTSKKFGEVLVQDGFHVHAPRGIVKMSIEETRKAFGI